MDRSVDSIGSCSLDADADSTDFSDTSGVITPSCAKDLTREFTSRIKERCQVSPIKCQQTAAFLDWETGKISTTVVNKQRSLDKNINCSDSNNIIINNNLNNINNNSNNNNNNNNINNNSRNNTPIITTEAGDYIRTTKSPIGEISSNIVTSGSTNPQKKPSYLNLACCVNGYSNFTTYDSAFRQNISKSREVSPIRPIGRNSNSTTTYVKSPGNYLTPPELTLPYSLSIASSGRSPDSRKIIKNMTTISDNSTISIMNDEKNGHRMVEKIIDDKNELLKTASPGDSTKVGKSFIQQRVERLYGSGAQNLYSPKRIIQKNNSENNECLKSPNNKFGIVTSVNGSGNGGGGGGGSGYELNCNSDVGENNNEMSEEDLPVLRHLRPEFRAQLPLISPKRTNLRTKFDNSDISNKNQNGGTANSHYTQNGNVSSLKEISSSSDSVDYIKAPTRGIPIANFNNNNGNSKIVPNLVEKEMKGIVNGSSSVKETKIVPELKNKNESEKELVNDNSNSSVEVLSNGNKISDKGTLKEITKDGHYFLDLLKIQQERLLGMAKMVEDEIDSLTGTNSEVPDEILGYLRAASGKSRLLVSQKMKQFADLCNSNINPVPNEKFPTTSGDLQGFWDMVNLQIDHVDSLFKDIDEMRESNWTKVPTGKKQNSNNSTVSSSSIRLPRKIIAPFPSTANGNNKNSATTSKKSSSDSAAQRREAQRRQLQELRRKHKKAKESGEQPENSSSVEIFIPSTSSTTDRSS